jgi:hypothetical protein
LVVRAKSELSVKRALLVSTKFFELD